MKKHVPEKDHLIERENKKEWENARTSPLGPKKTTFGGVGENIQGVGGGFLILYHRLERKRHVTRERKLGVQVTTASTGEEGKKKKTERTL